MKKVIAALMLFFGTSVGTNAQVRASISNGIVSEFQNTRGFVRAPFVSYQASADVTLDTKIGGFSAAYFGNYFFENNSLNKLKEWESDVFLSYHNNVWDLDYSMGCNFIHANKFGWFYEADISLAYGSLRVHGFYEFNSNGGGIEASVKKEFTDLFELKAEAIFNFKYYTPRNQLAGLRVSCNVPFNIRDDMTLNFHAKHLLSTSEDFVTNTAYGVTLKHKMVR